jgi:hypothetical protein
VSDLSLGSPAVFGAWSGGGWVNKAMLARGWGVVGLRGRAPSWPWETLTL